MADQAVLVLIKPDAVRRGLIGATLSRLEALHLDLIGAKVLRVSRRLAEAHYRPLRDRPFFEELLEYLQGNLHGTNAILALVWYGPSAIRRVRQVVGATHPEQAAPTSIRGALGRVTTAGVMENVVHASESVSEAAREIRLWFRPQELLRDLRLTRPVRRRSG